MDKENNRKYIHDQINHFVFVCCQNNPVTKKTQLTAVNLSSLDHCCKGRIEILNFKVESREVIWPAVNIQNRDSV